MFYCKHYQLLNAMKAYRVFFLTKNETCEMKITHVDHPFGGQIFLKAWTIIHTLSSYHCSFPYVLILVCDAVTTSDKESSSIASSMPTSNQTSSAPEPIHPSEQVVWQCLILAPGDSFIFCSPPVLLPVRWWHHKFLPLHCENISYHSFPNVMWFLI